MKKTIAAFILFASLPMNADEYFAHNRNHPTYDFQNGYAYENKCFRNEYREYYVPGNSRTPGYVKSYYERISTPCKIESNASNHYNYPTKPSYRYRSKPYYDYKIKPATKYVKNEHSKKCTGSTTLGGLIGGGLAASLSNKDAYGWTIPLGAVLGAGIGNAECN